MSIKSLVAGSVVAVTMIGGTLAVAGPASAAGTSWSRTVETARKPWPE